MNGKFDAIGEDLDESPFEQVAYGLLEHLLAHTKSGVDIFRWRFVVVRGETLFRKFEMLKKTGGEIANKDTTKPPNPRRGRANAT